MKEQTRPELTDKLLKEAYNENSRRNGKRLSNRTQILYGVGLLMLVSSLFFVKTEKPLSLKLAEDCLTNLARAQGTIERDDGLKSLVDVSEPKQKIEQYVQELQNSPEVQEYNSRAQRRDLIFKFLAMGGPALLFSGGVDLSVTSYLRERRKYKSRK